MDKRTIIFVLALSLAFFGIKFGFSYYETKEREEWLKKHGKELAKKTDPKQKIIEQVQAKEKPFVLPIATEAKNNLPCEYYVLENDYLQLVFSTVGAALVEINLPFKTKKNEKSVVLPIEFDREIVEQSPENAAFPLHSAKLASGGTKEKSIGGYYPLLRRTQLNKTNDIVVPPRFFALNVVSEFPEVASLAYKVKKFTDKEIVFEAEQAHRRITKRFYFLDNADDAPYSLTLDIKLEGDSRGLFLSSGIPEVEWISGSPGNVIKYHTVKGKSSVVEKIDLPKDLFTLTSASPDWICNSNGFLGFIINPTNDVESGFRAEFVPGTQVPSRLSLIDREYSLFPMKDMPGYNVQLPLKNSHEIMQYRLFLGPFDDIILKKVDAYYAQELGGKNSDYIACQTFHGWFAFISEPFAKFLFFLMKFFYNCFGSWALSIFLITCVLRLLLYPLNTWSMRSMKSMQRIAPAVKAIQERHKKDPQKAQQEIMKLYRENGVNPLSGCLPLIIQMPFLIGMFDLLKSAFELRGAVFIPGWINDLSAPDVLFSWNYPLPFIGNEFHLLPFVLGGIMFVQQNLMSNLPKDKSLWTDQQKQQRSMGNIMTLVMTVLFYQFPSGLNIYWISSMLLGIAQQLWTNKTMDARADAKADAELSKATLKPSKAKK